MEKILMMFPKHHPDPYLKCSINALSKEGIKMVFPKKMPNYFPFFKTILSSKCRIIHIQWLHSFTGSSNRNIKRNLKKFIFFIIDVLIIKLLLRCKIIWTVHNLYTYDVPYENLDKLGRKFFSRIADALICYCDQAKKLIEINYKKSPNKIHSLFSHGNYIDFYKNEISREEAREHLKLKTDDIVLFHFGRIRPYKGVDVLVKSFISLKKNENVKLLIAGLPDNRMLSYLKNISNDCKNIILNLNVIPKDEIQNYMNASDIIISPFKSILHSSSLLVGMGFAKPFIAPRIGCLIDILDGKGAFMYDSQDKEGLLKALQKALENKDKFIEMGKYNQKKVKNFEWQTFAREIKKVYYKFL